jgi:hypothetical protein
MLPSAIAWLRQIGKHNRELLRHCYFYDRNEHYDEYGYISNDGVDHRPLAKLKTSEVVTEMDGRIETMSSQSCCAHWVLILGAKPMLDLF